MALSPRAARAFRSATVADDPAFENSAFEEPDASGTMRWMGPRLRLLVAVALLGLLAVFALLRLLAGSPHIEAVWQPTEQGALVLASSPQPALQPLAGNALTALSGRDGQLLPLEPWALQSSPRWMIDDAERSRAVALQQRLSALLADGALTLRFGDGSQVPTRALPRGYAGLGIVVWVISALAALLFVAGAVVLLARPTAGSALYLLMALCQAANLMLIAAQSMPGLGQPALLAAFGLLPRAGFDLVTGAAIVHASTLFPLRLPGGRRVAAGAWLAVALLLAALAAGRVPGHHWWWAQGATLALGALAIMVLTRSFRLRPHPYAMVMRRFGLFAAGTLALLTLAVAVAHWQPAMPRGVASVSADVWYVFFASLLLLLPFLSRSRRALREFAMLAGISTVATSLDLLFVALFSLGQFASLTLAVVLSLGAYAAARQWILSQMAGSSTLSTERTFEHLYRVAREVQANPEQHAELLVQLLRDLFEPLEVLRLERASSRSRVVGDGSALLVPLPPAAQPGSDDEPGPRQTLALRFARRGQRMFTKEDARLTDRVVEQLRRAVAYDRAVEHGRNEERKRIAQDLHDDIGARLLTLMYQAQTPEMEEYIRHTLQDLKTLTRGLAATDHRLSWATAEWKADITQRLDAARLHLAWSFSFDHDMLLGVVQWSALTRVLRELVSNSIYHAGATRIEIVGRLENGRLTLLVADNGNGRDPKSWSHGLGLGGVRKRVKLLGGVVQWRENQPNGIVCEVFVADLAGRA